MMMMIIRFCGENRSDRESKIRLDWYLARTNRLKLVETINIRRKDQIYAY